MIPAYRNELKFLVDQAQYRQLRAVLRGLLPYDAHAGGNGGYHIRSLYFDDLYQTDYRQKMAGVEVRKKYRVRIYNCAPGPIALECKHKNGAYIYKESVPLTAAEYTALCRGTAAFCWARPSPWPPAFLWKAGPRCCGPGLLWLMTVRRSSTMWVPCASPLTRTSRPWTRARTSLTHGRRATMCCPPGQMILEVKFTGILPEYIQTIFHAYSFVRTSASKFCLCADRVRQVLR